MITNINNRDLTLVYSVLKDCFLILCLQPYFTSQQKGPSDKAEILGNGLSLGLLH